MFQRRVVEKIKSQVLCSKKFLQQNLGYEIMWNNIVQTENLRHMRFPCWLTKATDTHSDYIIFIFYDNSG